MKRFNFQAARRNFQDVSVNDVFNVHFHRRHRYLMGTGDMLEVLASLRTFPKQTGHTNIYLGATRLFGGTEAQQDVAASSVVIGELPSNMIGNAAH